MIKVVFRPIMYKRRLLFETTTKINLPDTLVRRWFSSGTWVSATAEYRLVKTSSKETEIKAKFVIPEISSSLPAASPFY